MTDLVSVRDLYASHGAPCHHLVVQGFLRTGIRLELFTENGWKTLDKARVTIGSAVTVSLTTSDKSVYTTRPDELLRVRFAAHDRNGTRTPPESR